MSQANVERIIGILATDEALRRRFGSNPHAFVQRMIESGMELNPCELEALSSLDAHALARFARAIDDRLQKSDLQRARR